jgi:tRNA dimethylallyltransferase
MNTIKTNFDLISVLGPTACGKTQFAARLAYKTGGEIISADSRQVYRHMNIGTGKDYEDYVVNGKKIPYHLVDIVDPGEKYNVFEYQNDFFTAFSGIKKSGKIPILCGGTGMYIDAVTKGYRLFPVPPDENLRYTLNTKTLEELTQILSSYKKLHNVTDADTKKRAIRAIEIEEYYLKNPRPETEHPKINTLFLGIGYDREIVKKRITERLKNRLENGMIEEVESLLKKGLTPEDLIYYGLEYKYITLYLTRQMNFDEMKEKLNIAIHQFAKRQMTWFRKMEKEGTIIHWLEGESEERLRKAIELIKQNS